MTERLESSGDFKCSYGCGRTARYKTGDGNYSCKPNASECPARRKKESKKHIFGYIKARVGK